MPGGVVEAAKVALSSQRYGPGVLLHSPENREISKLRGWGGPRANSGGRRPGAGRPRKRPAELLAIGPRWYCVETHGRCEVLAEQALTDEGFDAFCPIERREVVRSGKREMQDRPLFPRYLFVRLDTADPAWRSAAHCDGVRRILGRPERPTSIPEGLVESWLVRTVDGAVDGTPRALRLAAIQVGARVRLIAGPLTDIEAVVRMSDERRVELLHATLGIIKAPREAVMVAE